MKDIIIVGTGKAGFIHFNSYKKFNRMGRIFFVDLERKVTNPNIKSNKIYVTIEEVIEENHLDVNNIIVDICTPKSVFLNMISICKDLKIKDIIVEKPFIVEEDFFEKNKELNIVMVHNYLYSKITKKLKDILEKENYSIKSIYTNFSKNRMMESISRKGNA